MELTLVLMKINGRTFYLISVEKILFFIINYFRFGTNLTLFLDSLANFDVAAHLKLPLPNLNTYSIVCSSDTKTKYDKRYLSYLAKYYTQNKRYYSLAGNVIITKYQYPYSF